MSSEARKTFRGADGLDRVYRQVYLPFDDGQDLLMDIMDAVAAAVAQAPKDLIAGDDLNLRDVDLSDIVGVVSTFARHIRQLGKPSEFFARIFAATERQVMPPSDMMASLGEKPIRDAAFAGSYAEAWQVAWWVVWHNYAPFLTGAMEQLGMSLTSSPTPSEGARDPGKKSPSGQPLTAVPS